MTPTYHHDIIQGTQEWHDLRRGVLTSSAIRTLITPTGKLADNEKVRAHVYEIAAQRLTGRTEPTFMSFEMMRGHEEEVLARNLYSEKYAPVAECGFVTRNGVGYSPDGLVGEDGIIEIKSAKQRIQVERIIANVCPPEHYAQIQTGLWVTGRQWCDFVSYSNGMPMLVVRVLPDAAYFELIDQAVVRFAEQVGAMTSKYLWNANGLHVAPYIEPITGDEIEASDEV